MKVAVCLDDANGMMFNHRRQSRDRILLEDMIRECGDRPLFINEYSEKLLGNLENKVVSGDFLTQAQEEDLCFVEDQPLLPVEDSIRKLIIYRWNRLYPGDQFFDIPLEEHGWKLISTTEFAGSSHEKITREDYVR